jgi:hypothetical protein
MKPSSAAAEATRPLPTKKAYAAPELIRYGEVRVLTQSGSGGEPESMTGETIDGCDNSKNKRSCLSDRRAKQNIALAGRHPWGFGLYLFDYQPQHQGEYGTSRQFGVMADEVRDVVPAAVTQHDSGLMAVRYDMLGIFRAPR